MTKEEMLTKLKNGEISVDEAMNMKFDDETVKEDVEQEVKVENYVKTPKQGKYHYKWLIVHVVDEDDKVNIKVPLSLVKHSKKFMGNINLGAAEDYVDDIDFEALLDSIADGCDEPRLNIVNVESEGGGTVEIYFE